MTLLGSALISRAPKDVIFTMHNTPAATTQQSGFNVFRATCDDAAAPLHPGEILREDFLPHLGLPASGLAGATKIDLAVLNELLAERAAITRDLANSLSAACGTSPRYWLTLQLQYDLWHGAVLSSQQMR